MLLLPGGDVVSADGLSSGNHCWRSDAGPGLPVIRDTALRPRESALTGYTSGPLGTATSRVLFSCVIVFSMFVLKTGIPIPSNPSFKPQM